MTDLAMTGLEEADNALERCRKHLDLGLMLHLQRVADFADDDLRKNFDSEGKWFGRKWPLLAPATQDYRDFLIETYGLLIGLAHPILVNFGEFRESIVKKHGVNHERKIGRFTVRIASTHRKGKMTEAMAGVVDEGKGSAPPRRIIHPKGATENALSKMERELESYADVVVKLFDEGGG